MFLFLGVKGLVVVLIYAENCNVPFLLQFYPVFASLQAVTALFPVTSLGLILLSRSLYILCHMMEGCPVTEGSPF
jgi:hypothetical protein